MLRCNVLPCRVERGFFRGSEITPRREPYDECDVMTLPCNSVCPLVCSAEQLCNRDDGTVVETWLWSDDDEDADENESSKMRGGGISWSDPCEEGCVRAEILVAGRGLCNRE